jgi:hypothetical protein
MIRGVRHLELEVTDDGLCIGTPGTQVGDGGFQHSDAIVTLRVDVFHVRHVRFKIRRALLGGNCEETKLKEEEEEKHTKRYARTTL